MATKISTPKALKQDIQVLLDDAQKLFKEAASATGDKADALRVKGQSLLEDALEKAQSLQAVAVEKGKEVAAKTDDYVRENPWQTAAIALGAGVIAGLLLGRKK